MRGRRLPMVCCLFGSLAAFGPGQQPPDVDERLRGIEVIGLPDVLRGFSIGGPHSARSVALIEALAADWTTDQVQALTTHGDPKVRAVALIVLHEQLGHRAMPTLLRFVEDCGAAPPGPMTCSAPWPLPGTEAPLPPTRPQTVGAIARVLFARYLPHHEAKRLSPYNAIAGAYGPVYERYLRTHASRSHCLVWLSAALARSSLQHIKTVRAEIDAIAGPERHWYLLTLANDWNLTGREALATEAELVAAVRALGPDAVFLVLRGLGPADVAPEGSGIDPDLTASEFSPFAWRPLALFLLRHGEQLVPADRCDEWLAVRDLHLRHLSGGLGAGQEGILSADWYRVAAELQPERAREHLDAGWSSLPIDETHSQVERGRLALVEAARGDDGMARAVAWFYGEWPQPQFVRELARPEHTALLANLVRDERFERVAWGHVVELARACAANAGGAAPWSDRLVRDLQHPLGVGFYDFRRADRPVPRGIFGGVTIAAARELHPEATAALERGIDAVRDRLRGFAAARTR